MGKRKKLTKYAPYKTIDGKRYGFRNRFSSKIAAKAYAEVVRGRGYKIRVIKASGKYCVYGRKKR